MSSKIKLAPSGVPLHENMSVVDFYGVYPQDLPSIFRPIDFPPREHCNIQRRRTREQIRRFIED